MKLKVFVKKKNKKKIRGIGAFFRNAKPLIWVSFFRYKKPFKCDYLV